MRLGKIVNTTYQPQQYDTIQPNRAKSAIKKTEKKKRFRRNSSPKNGPCNIYSAVIIYILHTFTALRWLKQDQYDESKTRIIRRKNKLESMKIKMNLFTFQRSRFNCLLISGSKRQYTSTDRNVKCYAQVHANVHTAQHTHTHTETTMNRYRKYIRWWYAQCYFWMRSIHTNQ